MQLFHPIFNHFSIPFSQLFYYLSYSSFAQAVLLDNLPHFVLHFFFCCTTTRKTILSASANAFSLSWLYSETFNKRFSIGNPHPSHKSLYLRNLAVLLLLALPFVHQFRRGPALPANQ